MSSAAGLRAGSPRRRHALQMPSGEAAQLLRTGVVAGAVVLLVTLVSVCVYNVGVTDPSVSASASRSTVLTEHAPMTGMPGWAPTASPTRTPRDTDISMMVLDDHAAFRRWFAFMDEFEEQAKDEYEKHGKDAEKEGHATRKLASIWKALTLHLEIHADAEEKLLYPKLVRKGGKDAKDETKDAIGDHNKIRDAIAHADKHPVGSAEWWKGVGDARVENTDHLGEEEDEALPDFRRHTSRKEREALGEKWLQFYKDHPKGRGLDLHENHDPDEYVKKYDKGDKK